MADPQPARRSREGVPGPENRHGDPGLRPWPRYAHEDRLAVLVPLEVDHTVIAAEPMHDGRLRPRRAAVDATVGDAGEARDGPGTAPC